MTTYTYSLISDFTNVILPSAIDIGRFMKEIRDTVSITTPLCMVGIDGDVVTILFEFPITAPELAALNILVANHTGPNPEFDRTAIIQDVKPSGTDGGSFSSAVWTIRDLNTISGRNVDYWINLGINNFTLAEGTYKVRANSAASPIVLGNQIRLYCATTSQVVILGQNSIREASLVGNLIVPVGGATYQLEHICQSSLLITGLGSALGFGDEIYTTIEIIRSS